VQVISDLSVPPWPGVRSVITIGAFDGVHVGHAAVVAQVRALAAEAGARSVVVTFDRHPASVVRPESAPRLLTDLPTKLELLAETGLDATVVLRFDEARSQESARDFVQEILVDALATRTVVIGEDFHFGRHREGNVAPVSSTAIRRALAGGEVDVAARLLGHLYEARGPVVTGDMRGRLLGFPTANVEVPNAMCHPADGVYAGWYVRPDGSVHPCAINLGRRPTFYEHADHSLLEAHLLDFSGDLYGEPARVRFQSFLRSERKFDGIDALIAQLKHDIESTRRVLGA